MTSIVEKAIRRQIAMKKLDNLVAELTAMILYIQADKYETFLLNGLANEKAVKEIKEVVGQKAIDKVQEEIILLGCCQRFRDDIIANYPPAKTAIAQYNALVSNDPSMELFD